MNGPMEVVFSTPVDPNQVLDIFGHTTPPLLDAIGLTGADRYDGYMPGHEMLGRVLIGLALAPSDFWLLRLYDIAHAATEAGDEVSWR